MYAVAFSPDGTRVATGSAMAARGCSTRRPAPRSPAWTTTAAVYAVAFSPDGTRVATGSGDAGGSARVFDAATGAEISRLDHDGGVYAVAFSPDGTRVATGSSDGSARVFDAATGAEISRLDHDGDVSAVAFSPDGTRVATGSSRRGSARVFDAATGAEISRLDHDGAVNAVAFSPDGTRVATGSSDRGQRAGVRRGDRRRDLPPGPRRAGVRGGVQPGRHPGGHRQQRDGSARVFDAATGAEISRLDHDGAAWTRWRSARTAPGWPPAAAMAARGCSTRRPARRSSRLDHGGVHAVAFSPDGTRVATGSDDGSARVWCADHGQLIEQAMGRLTRNLTQQEWRRYFRDEPYRKTRADLP